MKLSNKLLYKEISSIQIDDESVDFSFSDRLSRENDWESDFCKKSIIEYKKFIYLTCIANKPLTPSDQVDQVWHLHLTYTQSYWKDLCQNILKHELHHGPTKGGNLEYEKYKKQYQYTLTLYQKEFGEQPPSDIWPELDLRFKNVDKFTRVNKATHWLIQKPSRHLATLMLAPLFLVACSADENEYGFWFYVKALFGVYVIYKILKFLHDNTDGKGGGCSTGGCSGCGGCGG